MAEMNIGFFGDERLKKTLAVAATCLRSADDLYAQAWRRSSRKGQIPALRAERPCHGREDSGQPEAADSQGGGRTARVGDSGYQRDQLREPTRAQTRARHGRQRQRYRPVRASDAGRGRRDQALPRLARRAGVETLEV